MIERDGYVIERNVTPGFDLESLRAEADGVIADARSRTRSRAGVRDAVGCSREFERLARTEPVMPCARDRGRSRAF